jgi:hypothetical protein
MQINHAGTDYEGVVVLNCLRTNQAFMSIVMNLYVR